jgi:hypothetical protein
LKGSNKASSKIQGAREATEEILKLTTLFQEEPIPMESEIQVDGFPMEIFPKKMNEVLQKWARSFFVSNDFFAIPELVLGATAIGARSSIEIKQGWCEPLVIYAA